jgi:hypothetical protein
MEANLLNRITKFAMAAAGEKRKLLVEEARLLRSDGKSVKETANHLIKYYCHGRGEKAIVLNVLAEVFQEDKSSIAQTVTNCHL